MQNYWQRREGMEVEVEEEVVSLHLMILQVMVDMVEEEEDMVEEVEEVVEVVHHLLRQVQAKKRT